MQWIPANTTGQSHSWILKEDETVAELKFSLASHTLRLYAVDIRQFFLEASGSNKQRIIITSEYGILLGELQAFHQSQEGSLYLNQQKYYYKMSDSGLLFYDTQKQPVTECAIANINDLTLFERASLIFGFVWVWQTRKLQHIAVQKESSFG